jgi:hypothetical protein
MSGLKGPLLRVIHIKDMRQGQAGGERSRGAQAETLVEGSIERDVDYNATFSLLDKVFNPPSGDRCGIIFTINRSSDYQVTSFFIFNVGCCT